MKSMDTLEELKKVLQQKSKEGLRTAVPILGHGINMQAARHTDLSIKDDWHDTLLWIAGELKIDSSEFNRLPFTGPLLWDTLVRKKASISNLFFDEAGMALTKILTKKLIELEQKTKSLPFYGKILSASFENIISLNIDQRLSLHSGSSKFISKTDEWGSESLSRHRLISFREGKTTRVWHFYGDTEDHTKIQLGLNSHADMLMILENKRAYLMHDWIEYRYLSWDVPKGGSRIKLQSPKKFYEKRRNSITSCYDLMFLAPLVIIGASLSLEEWPMWWLLHQRARNFVPFKSSEVPKTFYLVTKDEIKPQIKGRPCDMEVVEFSSHDELWKFVLDACSSEK